MNLQGRVLNLLEESKDMRIMMGELDPSGKVPVTPPRYRCVA
jgi:hypothetical protein